MCFVRPLEMKLFVKYLSNFKSKDNILIVAPQTTSAFSANVCNLLITAKHVQFFSCKMQLITKKHFLDKIYVPVLVYKN